MTGRDIFKTFKPLLNVLVYVIKPVPTFIKVFWWDILKPYSQKFFIAIRYVLLKSIIKECGDNVRIGCNVTIIHWSNLTLGSNISIHDNCYLDAAGGLIIKNDVSIAHSSSILTTNHSWEDIIIPIKYNPLIKGSVTIENDVWIGCGCRVLANVTIKSRSIIAAGAVVNKDIEGHSIFGGVPAKLIKKL